MPSAAAINISPRLSRLLRALFVFPSRLGLEFHLDGSGNLIPPRDDSEFEATVNPAEVRLEPIR